MAGERPDIVLILADDMGYADIGAHGCEEIPTPHIDRIAREGVRFTDAYANGSFCTPTRVGLMSCRYQQRTGNDDLPQVTGPLPLSVKTLAGRLQEAGYTTGMVGKWHLGDRQGYGPLNRGFDEFFGFLGGGHTYFPDRPFRGSYGSPIFRQTEPSSETRYLTDAFGAEAAAFLRRHRDSEKPLFLYLAFNAVHTPMHATDRYLKRFPDLSGKRKIYAAMLSAMDDAIGEVLKELDASGKAEETLVIFHNDNGGPTTRNAVNGSINKPLRGSKCETFEGGIRVPLFLRWPGKIEAGSVYRKAVITFDLSATALRLAKADVSQIDGVDLLPYLSGEKKGMPHETLYWRCRTRNNNYAVRHGDWKYVYATEGTEQPGPKQTPARDMLFDLAEDVGETTDLSEQHTEKLRELKAMFAKWDAEMDADCRKLGINPPRVKRSSQKEPPFAATRTFPGFDVLSRVAVETSKEGYRVSSDGDGLVLKKLEAPLKESATFALDITPRREVSCNGFFAFGKEPTNADTIKCGLLVGGNRVSIYQGPYGSESATAAVPLVGEKTYQVTIRINLPEGKVTLTAAGKTVTHPLPRDMDQVHYIGYAVVRTRTRFGDIKVRAYRGQHAP